MPQITHPCVPSSKVQRLLAAEFGLTDIMEAGAGATPGPGGPGGPRAKITPAAPKTTVEIEFNTRGSRGDSGEEYDEDFEEDDDELSTASPVNVNYDPDLGMPGGVYGDEFDSSSDAVLQASFRR